MHNNTFIIRCRGLIMHDGKLLIVKHKDIDTYYALPGGKMEQGENPLECIKREILEKLGVAVQDPQLAYVYNYMDKKGRQNTEFFFLIKNGADFIDLSQNHRTHDFEIAEIVWMNKGDDFNLLPEAIKSEFAQNKFEFQGVRFI